MMKSFTVTFTDDEAAAIEKYAEFMQHATYEAIDQEYTPEIWIRDVITNELGMAKMRIVTSDTTNANQPRQNTRRVIAWS